MAKNKQENKAIQNSGPATSGLDGATLLGSEGRKATTKTHLRDQFVSEIAHYLLANNGPDENGRAHPIIKRIQVTALEEGIRAAEKAGLPKGFSPYHFQGHLGTYAISRYVDEVLVKKCRYEIATNFGGSVHAFITGADKRVLLSPLLDTVNGGEVQVSMHAVAAKFAGSPYLMLQRFCALTPELSEYAKELRPYHLARASAHTFDDPDTVKEMLGLRIEDLVTKTFGGDFHRFVTTVTQDDFARDLEVTLAGKPVRVSFKGVSVKHDMSPYALVMAYCAEHPEYKAYTKELQPYHMNKSGPNTYADPKMIDEVVAKKIRALQKEAFGGSWKQLRTNLTAEHLATPFTDTVAGKPVAVSFARVFYILGSSPAAVIERFETATKKLGLP